MQTTQVQRDAVSVSKLRKTDKKANAVSTAVQNGDPFAAIFEMIAQSLQQGNNSPSPDTGGGNAPAGGVQQAAGLQKINNSLMEQLAGPMLAQNPQLAAFLQADNTKAQQILSNLQLPANVQQSLMSLRQNLLTMLQQQTTAVQTATTPSQTIQQVVANSPDASTQTVQNGKTPANNTNDVAQGASTAAGADPKASAQSSADLLTVNQFVQNVREAKKLMNNTQQKSRQTPDADSIDVDALQNHAQASRTIISTAALKTTGQMEAQTTNLSSQIKTSVAENLLNGKQEFIIKLKPEGLGEITVKLTEKAGEATTLHLMTANAETAQLINSNLGSLKEAMRPLQVVVESAQSQQTGNGAEQAAQQQASQQQFNAFGQHSSNHHQYHGFQYFDADAELESTPITESQDDSALDSYI